MSGPPNGDSSQRGQNGRCSSPIPPMVGLVTYDEAERERVVLEAQSLRGQYLDKMCLLDQLIDYAICAYFDIPSTLHVYFRSTVLTNVGFAKKVEALRTYINDNDLQAEFGAFPAELSSANTLRNRFAHSSTAASDGTYSAEMIYLEAVRKGRLVMVGYTLTELRAEMGVVDQLFDRLHQLRAAFAAIGDAETRRRNSIQKWWEEAHRVAPIDALGEDDPRPGDA